MHIRPTRRVAREKSLSELAINLNCWHREMPSMKKSLLFAIVVKAVGELLFIFGLLGWAYGVLIQFFIPELLPIQMSHLTPWLRIDTFTIISFILSAVGFFIWRLTKELFLLSKG